jgi:hypothetical protein
MIFRDSQGRPSPKIAATRGASDRTAILATAIPFVVPFGPSDEGANFWVIGDISREARDITVTSIEPQGGATTRISGTIYDERIWEGTLPYLTGNVPW